MVFNVIDDMTGSVLATFFTRAAAQKFIAYRLSKHPASLCSIKQVRA